MVLNSWLSVKLVDVGLTGFYKCLHGVSRSQTVYNPVLINQFGNGLTVFKGIETGVKVFTIIQALQRVVEWFESGNHIV